LKNWQKNYGAIIGCAVGFQVFVILVHALLTWGATTGEREIKAAKISTYKHNLIVYLRQ